MAHSLLVPTNSKMAIASDGSAVKLFQSDS